MSNWKEYKLGEIADITSSKRIFLADYVEKGIPFYRSKEIIQKANGEKVPNPLFIETEKYFDIKERFGSPQNGDLLISAVGERSGIPYVVKDDGDFYFKDGNLIWFKNFSDKISSVFLYYFIRSNKGFSAISATMIGSAQRALTIIGLKNLKVNFPPLPTQTAIAEILSSLDDKIELNNKINQELENLAQTLFKQWFIDFEFPNQNGEPYKSSGGEMIDSELGEVPKGWEVKPITDFIEVKDGTHDSPKQCEEGNYLITSKHLKNSFIDFDSAYKISNEDFVNVNKRSKVDKNDILITMIGTVGNLYYVGNEPYYAIKNIGLFKSSTSESFSIYLYEYLKSSFISEYYRVRLAGSTQQYLTLKVLRETPIIYNENVVTELVDAIKEMRNTIINNSNENQELTNLRDTLLPKLISGELEVSEVKEG
jgi:type I restriction enzyme S subunit